MPYYRRRQIKSRPGYWEMNELLIITPEPAVTRRTNIPASVIRDGAMLIASLFGTLAARAVLPAIQRRLTAPRQPRLAAPRQLQLPPPKKDEV